VASYQLVQGVDEWRCTQPSQHACEDTGEAELGEDRNAASTVARHRRAIAEHKPPTFAPRFLGHGCEQAIGLLVG